MFEARSPFDELQVNGVDASLRRINEWQLNLPRTYAIQAWQNNESFP
jgi:hypothetical protein